MENTKNSTIEQNRAGAAKAQAASSQVTDKIGDVANQAASAAQRAREGVQSAYDETRQVVSDAYGKTTEVLSDTYNQAMVYGKQNPGKLTLIAFGAGIGIGVLLASGLSGGRSRTSRIGEPIVAALSQVALEFLR
jgi:ElaB/YqjD/DUF883 family membrane-anchored ribosome-binding protein